MGNGMLGAGADLGSEMWVFGELLWSMLLRREFWDFGGGRRELGSALEKVVEGEGGRVAWAWVAMEV